MTVKEAIEILKDLDQNLPLGASDGEVGEYEIDEIQVLDVDSVYFSGREKPRKIKAVIVF